ncbi:SSRP1 [Symbiodinium sp. CCMP2592]|nr:SSRP1 [Symbiodinium sp. CCMP2592]
MAKYDADMNAFIDAGGGVKRKAGTQATTKDPAAPKKPVGGGFGCFLAQNRAAFSKDVKGQPATAVTKLASKKWKYLSEDEKKVYQEEYEMKKAGYEQAKKLYVRLATDREAEKHVKKVRLAMGNKEAAKGTEDAEKAAAKEKSAEKEIKAKAKVAKAAKAKAKAKASPRESRRPSMKVLPLAPFDCFYAQIRAGARLYNSVPISAIGKSASYRWAMLGEDGRTAYREEYERQKAEYEAVKSAELAGIDQEEIEKLGEIQTRSACMRAFIDAGEKKGTKRKADKAVTMKDPTTPKKPAEGALGSGFPAQNSAAFSADAIGHQPQLPPSLAPGKDAQQEHEYAPLPSAEKEETEKAQSTACDSPALPLPAMLLPAVPLPAMPPILPLEIAKYAKRREKERLEKLENNRRDLEHYKGKARRERDRRRDLEKEVERYKRKGKRLEEDVEHYKKKARRERDQRKDLENDVGHYKRKATRERTKRRDLEDRLEVLSVLYLREGYRVQASAA